MQLRIPMKRQFDLKLLFAFMPIFILQSCLSGLFKIEGLTIIVCVACFAIWLYMINKETPDFLGRAIYLTLPLFICVGILFCSMILSDNDVTPVNFKNAIYLIIITFVFFYYLFFGTYNSRKTLLSLCFFDLLVSSLYSIYVLQANPDIARIMSTGSFEKYNNYDYKGVISFGVIYGLVCLLPVVLDKMFNSNRKLAWSAVLCIVISSIFLAKFSVAIIIGIVGIVLYFFIKKTKFSFIKKCILVASIMIVLFALESILLYLIESDLLPYEIERRAQDIYAFLFLSTTAQTNDLVFRLNLYKSSFDAIFSNGLIGQIIVGNGFIGEHSEILDMLARYGIVYFAVILVFFVGLFKRIMSIIPKEKNKLYVLCIVLFVVLSFLNRSMWSSTMVILIGIIPLLLINDEENSASGDINVLSA